MKQILTLLLLLCSMPAAAQDVIAKNNKQIIKCRIVEETEDEVTYNKWEDLNGRTYVLNKADVFSIERDENIEAKIAEMAGTNAPTVLVETPSAQVDDEYLKMLDAQRHPFATVQFNPYEKRLRILKWTTISTAIAAPALYGVACMFFGQDQDDYPLNDTFGEITAGLMFASAATAITTGIWYGSLKHKVQRNIYSASLYEQGYTFKNGTRFSASTDLIRDSRTNQTAIGLGFHYNF